MKCIMAMYGSLVFDLPGITADATGQKRRISGVWPSAAFRPLYLRNLSGKAT